MQPTEFEIRELSYFIWEREGRPEGRALDHWFRAAAELAPPQAATTGPKPRRRRADGEKAAAGTAGKKPKR